MKLFDKSLLYCIRSSNHIKVVLTDKLELLFLLQSRSPFVSVDITGLQFQTRKHNNEITVADKCFDMGASVVSEGLRRRSLQITTNNRCLLKC